MTQIINLNFQLKILKKKKLQSRQKEENNNKGKINDIKKRKTTEKNSMKPKRAF